MVGHAALQQAFPDLPIHGIHARGPNPQQNFPGADLRNGEIQQLQGFPAVKASDADGFHFFSSFERISSLRFWAVSGNLFSFSRRIFPEKAKNKGISGGKTGDPPMAFRLQRI
jgi:hypothetical protein